ncbi:MAG TPA: 6-phosphogluconolactonase [Devosiaceae bacterium]|nr:6-phosphogluconolactonase [Devosiaceae bacterium]
MTATRLDFPDRPTLARALADAVAQNINAALIESGVAAIAVSGGTTPAKFFVELGKHRELDWTKVFVTLVDERWVDETSDRSNAQLVNEKMLQGPAAVAHFVPLYSGGEAPDAAALERTERQLAVLPRHYAAVLLGMGNDGHTASFFPGADNLYEALNGEGPVVAIRAPGAGEPRITQVLRRLLDTSALYLHIEGEEKAATLERALADGPIEEMPIRAVLRQQLKPLEIYWAP